MRRRQLLIAAAAGAVVVAGAATAIVFVLGWGIDEAGDRASQPQTGRELSVFERPDALSVPRARSLAVPSQSARVTFPSERALDRARRYAKRRAGLVSFAVIDTGGNAYHYRGRARYASASVVKAMFLAAYLRKVKAEARGLTGSERALLGPMIRVSDNDAAAAVYGLLGSAGVERVARAAGMRDFAGIPARWPSGEIAALDQARFLARLEQLVPRRFYRYARRLLRTIVDWQTWAFPPSHVHAATASSSKPAGARARASPARSCTRSRASSAAGASLRSPFSPTASRATATGSQPSRASRAACLPASIRAADVLDSPAPGGRQLPRRSFCGSAPSLPPWQPLRDLRGRLAEDEVVHDHQVAASPLVRTQLGVTARDPHFGYSVLEEADPEE